MQSTQACEDLIDFRRAVYHTLGLRKDSLFSLSDAVLVATGPETLARHTLAPVFERRWSSASDALCDGRLSAAALRRLLARQAVPTAVAGREVWAVDGTIWPRPSAKTSCERTYGHQPRDGSPDHGVVAAWEYQWLVAVPAAHGSWILPLDVVRRNPGAGSPTALAIGQLRSALRLRPAGAARPVVTFDSQYDVADLARASLAADLLIRLPSRRRFFRPPPPYSGMGPRTLKHGPVFKLPKPSTHGTPDRTQVVEDATHGRMQIDVWQSLHDQHAADLSFAVIRVTAARLPRHDRPPKPLWLVWIGGPLPTDLFDLWHWYRCRFIIEHGFRFAKQDLGWTHVRPMAPESADRWTWLLVMVFWQLWLGRLNIADRRLPWESPSSTTGPSPGRVRRAFAGLLARVGTPVRPPQPRGNSPGRQPGQCPGPRSRFPVARRTPARAH